MASTFMTIATDAPETLQARRQQQLEIWRKRREELGMNCALSRAYSDYDPKVLEQVDFEVSDLATEMILPHINPGDHIVNVGAGAGRFSLRAIPHILSKGGIYTDLDICEEMVEDTKDLLAKEGVSLGNVKIEVGDLLQLTWGNSSPIKPGSVKILILGRVLIHLTDQEGYDLALNEICRASIPPRIDGFIGGGLALIYGPEIDDYYMRDAFMKTPGETLLRTGKAYERDFRRHGFEAMKGEGQRIYRALEEFYYFRLFQKMHTDLHR